MIPLSDTTKKTWQDEKGKETSEITLSITNHYLIKNVDTQNKGKIYIVTISAVPFLSLIF